MVFLELPENCSNYLISNKAHSRIFPEYPPTSPDLSCLDFSIWPNLIQKVNADGWPRTMAGLRSKVTGIMDNWDQNEINLMVTRGVR